MILRAYSGLLMAWHYIREDTQKALLMGVLSGIALAGTLTIFPGKPWDLSLDPPKRKEQLVLDTEKLDAKSKQAEKVLGIPREYFKKAVVEATKEANETEDYDETGFAGIFGWAALAVAGACYLLLRKHQDAELLTSLARFFPREANALGLLLLSTDENDDDDNIKM